jgi:hypothetical protein
MKRRTDALLNREVTDWLDRLSKNTKLEAWLIENDILRKAFSPSQSRLIKVFFPVARARVLDFDLARQRALYLALDLGRDLDLDRVLALDLDLDLDSIFQQPNIDALNDYLLGWLRIVECLTKSGCYVSKEAREKILSEVLLPPSVADQTPDAESH